MTGSIGRIFRHGPFQRLSGRFERGLRAVLIAKEAIDLSDKQRARNGRWWKVLSVNFR